MNPLSFRQVLAVAVVLCILVVGGLASAQSIAHESHHGHHEKATHGTVLCSWMCAAGQVLDANAAPPLTEYAPIGAWDHVVQISTLHIALESPTSRGPPVRFI